MKAILLQDHARREIISEFKKWLAKNSANPNPAAAEEAFAFYNSLLAEGSDLLNFRYPGPDKWDLVHLWLSNAGLVSD